MISTQTPYEKRSNRSPNGRRTAKDDPGKGSDHCPQYDSWKTPGSARQLIHRTREQDYGQRVGHQMMSTSALGLS